MGKSLTVGISYNGKGNPKKACLECLEMFCIILYFLLFSHDFWSGEWSWKKGRVLWCTDCSPMKNGDILVVTITNTIDISVRN